MGEGNPEANKRFEKAGEQLQPARLHDKRRKHIVNYDDTALITDILVLVTEIIGDIRI